MARPSLPSFGVGAFNTPSRWTGTGHLDALEQAAHRFVSGTPLAIEVPKWIVEVFPARRPARVNPRA